MTRTLKADTIRLESLPCAAACLASGCTLAELKSISQGRFEFYIAGLDAELVAADFLMGRLEGNLLTFMRCFDNLHAAIRRQGEASLKRKNSTIPSPVETPISSSSAPKETFPSDGTIDAADLIFKHRNHMPSQPDPYTNNNVIDGFLTALWMAKEWVRPIVQWGMRVVLFSFVLWLAYAKFSFISEMVRGNGEGNLKFSDQVLICIITTMCFDNCAIVRNLSAFLINSQDRSTLKK